MRRCDVKTDCTNEAAWRRAKALATPMANTEAACEACKLLAGDDPLRPWLELRPKIELEVSSAPE